MNRFEAAVASASYGRLKVLGRVELSLEGGDMLVVLGANGAGKTTTLRAIIGTVSSTERRLRLDAADLTPLAAWRLAGQGVSLVPDGARTFANLTVLDNLRGAYMSGRGRRDVPPESDLLEKVFSYFPILREKRPSLSGTLSGGQRQMLAVGRALMTAPRVLLLDEPSAGLAPKIVEDLFEVLGVIKRESACAIVMAEQNVGYATRIADHCIVLEEGEVALSGPMNEVIHDERLRTAYLGL